MATRGLYRALRYTSGLFPLRELQDLCAAAKGESGSPAIRWSAVKGSLSLAGSLHK